MNVGPCCLKAMKSPGLHSLSITAGSPGKSRIEIIKGFEHVRGLKGHESIAQVLAWVCIANGSALKGRQKIALIPAVGIALKTRFPG
jgi:hypothetical protein